MGCPADNSDLICPNLKQLLPVSFSFLSLLIPDNVCYHPPGHINQNQRATLAPPFLLPAFNLCASPGEPTAQHSLVLHTTLHSLSPISLAWIILTMSTVSLAISALIYILHSGQSDYTKGQIWSCYYFPESASMAPYCPQAFITLSLALSSFRLWN